MVLINKSGPETLEIGQPAPDFSLPGVDGRTYSLEQFKDCKGVVLVFTCNHCPYARAYDERLAELVHTFSSLGIGFAALNSNDAVKYPEDGFDKMKERAEAENMAYPYLHDESQETARAYGAVCTPHFFVLDADRVLVYEGRLDDNWKEPEAAECHDLRDALEAVLAGEPVPTPQTSPMGCSIKWKA